MNIALFILYTLFGIELLLRAHQHGKKREGIHNFWTGLLALTVELVLIWWSLGWHFL